MMSKSVVERKKDLRSIRESDELRQSFADGNADNIQEIDFSFNQIE